MHGSLKVVAVPSSTTFKGIEARGPHRCPARGSCSSRVNGAIARKIRQLAVLDTSTGYSPKYQSSTLRAGVQMVGSDGLWETMRVGMMSEESCHRVRGRKPARG